MRIRSGLERSNGARAVPFVPPLNVGKNRGLVSRLASSPEFGGAPARAHLRLGDDENFHVRVRTNHSSDVAPVKHRAGRRRGKLALERK